MSSYSKSKKQSLENKTKQNFKKSVSFSVIEASKTSLKTCGAVSVQANEK